MLGEGGQKAHLRIKEIYLHSADAEPKLKDLSDLLRSVEGRTDSDPALLTSVYAPTILATPS